MPEFLAHIKRVVYQKVAHREAADTLIRQLEVGGAPGGRVELLWPQ